MRRLTSCVTRGLLSRLECILLSLGHKYFVNTLPYFSGGRNNDHCLDQLLPSHTMPDADNFTSTHVSWARRAQLMAVPYNLVTPRNGEPLVAATQDFLTAAYLITQRDIFFDRETFCRVVSYLGDAGEHADVPAPAILKPVALWTGKQVGFGFVLVGRSAAESFACVRRLFSLFAAGAFFKLS